MNKKLRERLLQINTRVAEIDTELGQATTEEVISRLSQEASGLIEERGRIVEKLATEARNALITTTIEEPNTEAQAEERGISVLSRRQKVNLVAGRSARGKNFTDIEKRALGVALTTTAETFVAATAELDGVNNGGIFIPVNVVLDLLREEGKISPILADIKFTSIPGLVEFPYRESRTKANSKKEGLGTDDNQMKWSKLQLVKGFLQIVIPVTDELKALTDMDFGAYIMDQILQDLTEDWTEDLIYGTGTDDKIKGITVGASVVEYEKDKATTGIITAIKKLNGKFRRGAKLYVAQDVYDSIFFDTDANGNFKYPVFNNSTGISSIGVVRLEMDENLKEGEFLYGNVANYFKANSLKPLSIETDRHARKGITDYVANEFCATSPFAGAFVHGKVKE